MSSATTATLAALCADLGKWDRSVAAARALRARMLTTAMSREKAVGEDATIVRSYALAWQEWLKVKGDQERANNAAKMVAHIATPGAHRFLAPVLGDPFGMSDPEAVLLLPVLPGPWPADETLRRLLRVFYMTRRRPTWVPAADALARLALHDEPTRDWLVGEWMALFPQGLGKRWPQGGFGSVKVEGEPGKKTAHRVRHVLRAVCAWMALGGEDARLADLTAASFVTPEVPSDEVDASAVLLALQALLCGEGTRSAVEERLAACVARIQAEQQAEAVLREIAEDPALRPDLVRAIEAHLAQPAWCDRSLVKQVDSLWSWIETAAWLAGRERVVEVLAMRAACPAAVGALALRLDGALPTGEADATSALVTRLRTLLDGNAFLSTAESTRAPLVVETLLLMARREAAGLPWARLAAHARGVVDLGGPARDEAGEGTAAQVGRAGLAVALARWTREAPQVLLHDAALDEATVFDLAGVQNGAIANQVAVQAERLLRQAPDGCEQVKLLWKVVRAAPLQKAFTELGDVLRDDPAQPGLVMKEVVETIRGLYKEGDEAGNTLSPELDGPRFASVLDSLASLLPAGAAERPAALLGKMSASFRSLTKRFDPPLHGLARLEDVLFGGPGNYTRTGDAAEGLVGWLHWLDEASPDLAGRWRPLAQVVREAAAAQVVARELGEDIAAAVAGLREMLCHVPRVERLLLDRELDALLAWKDGVVEGGVQRAQARKELEGAIQSADPAEVVRVIERRAADLPEDAIRHGYDVLLDRLCFFKARGLKRVLKNAEIDVKLPSLMSRTGTLLVGVTAGTMLILDFGTAWNEILPRGVTPAYLAVIAVGLLAAYLLLASEVSSHLPRPEQFFMRRWGRVFRHVALTYGAAVVWAGVTSAGALWSLDGTSVRKDCSFLLQLPLWTSLSLFFGLFMGLVLGGRRFLGEK